MWSSFTLVRNRTAVMWVLSRRWMRYQAGSRSFPACATSRSSAELDIGAPGAASVLEVAERAESHDRAHEVVLGQLLHQAFQWAGLHHRHGAHARDLRLAAARHLHARDGLFGGLKPAFGTGGFDEVAAAVVVRMHGAVGVAEPDAQVARHVPRARDQRGLAGRETAGVVARDPLALPAQRLLGDAVVRDVTQQRRAHARRDRLAQAIDDGAHGAEPV